MTTSTLPYPGHTAEDLACIPAELKTRMQWILWRGADRIDTDTGEIIGLNKIPINPQTLHKADTTDPRTWSTFDECVAALPVALEEWQQEDSAGYRGGGLGFVFAHDDSYVGIDLDHCRDPHSGTMAAWAQAHINLLASYTELSPSGTGVHILVEGTLPPKGRKKAGVEMYKHARFFTVTGWHVPGTPPTVERRAPQLAALWCMVFGAQPGQSVWLLDPHGTITNHDGKPWTITRIEPAPDGEPYAFFADVPSGWPLVRCEVAPAPPAQTHASPPLEDTVLLAKAKAAKNGAKFTRLWEGDTSLHDHDDSAADLALCDILAFWTQDALQIDRLFRQSGLMRQKWDEKRGDQTYGERTIAKALARQTDHYTPAHGAQLLVGGAVQQAHEGQNGHTPGFDLAALLVALEHAKAEDRLQQVLDAIEPLAGLPFPTWMATKLKLKTLAPTLNLNDLERLRTETRQTAQAQQQAAALAARPAWEQTLFTSKSGEVLETENNLQAIFAHHPTWEDRLWWDVVANRAYLDAAQPLDIHYVRNEVSPWLGSAMKMPVRSCKGVLEVMRSWAHRTPRDPIQEWLHSLPESDPKDRRRKLLDTWLHRYAGAEDTPYTRFISRLLPVSLVKRALCPGVQYRYVVVLEGEENLGKTKLLHILGDRWHQEFPKSVEGKEAYRQLQGYWLIELGELDALKPAQESRIKMFISQQMDVWVPKYENDPIERPRRAILVGTTNEREYLKGEHGNTRYLPIWLDGPIKHDAIAKVRDRLFTQARAFLAAHPKDWWCIPPDVTEELSHAREARREPSVLEDALSPWLAELKKQGRHRCTVAEALEYLQVPKDRWNKRLEMDVAKAIKGCGWFRHVEYDPGTQKMERVWADTPQEKGKVPF